MIFKESDLVHIFIISDSIGETGELVAKAALSQFEDVYHKARIKRFTHIDSLDHIQEIVDLAKSHQAIIIYTLVRDDMKQQVANLSEKAGVEAIDLMGPVIEKFEKVIGIHAMQEPGLVRRLDEDYFAKIEAVEFAVKYDDGRDPRGLLQADIVLVGVSRTSKTPLSQYLANKRWKVANVPLVPEVDPPEELFHIDPAKCFGLVINPEKLNSIRRERLKAIGLSDEANYAKIERIQEELKHFHSVVDRIGCEVIDVTNRAVEETANIIISKRQESTKH
ncbi:phosphoenolpyruvate synthase regulatory protein [Chryseomicrobium excrementi]|uniref:Putative pyruvate, phosphate dikinase regulatory protein n=1 Tax=Chryseomicrobium excrementi TaxID=2041346 RepID=A0A2M9F274_9BACL|nr:pyruvate, water dikinase regulatory protein [Chryseomicrobium excrementi]PJK17561.1 phosphoenolpyruvate synthase regulatory protein [Chryseomicrobium excrementi]